MYDIIHVWSVALNRLDWVDLTNREETRADEETAAGSIVRPEYSTKVSPCRRAWKDEDGTPSENLETRPTRWRIVCFRSCGGDWKRKSLAREDASLKIALDSIKSDSCSRMTLMAANSGYAGSSDGASESPDVVEPEDSIMLARREEARDSGGVSDERRLGRLVLGRGGEATRDEDEEERLLDNLTCKVGGAPAISMSNGQCCDSSRAGRCS